MTRSSSRVTKHTVATELNGSQGANHVPNVGEKMFRLTSASARGIS